MTERIIVEIDASELELVLLKLETISDLTKDLFGGAGGGGGRGRSLGTVLPGINRELRLIVGRVPGMRIVMHGYFALTRGKRAYRKFVSPDYSRHEGTMAVALTAAATVLLLVQRVQQMIKEIERQEEKFRLFVMQSRNFTRGEFERENVLWKYYLKGQP